MIPRPPTARPGGPPPWQPRRSITLRTVVKALERSGRQLPPGPLQPSVPIIGPRTPTEAPSAVLVALFEEAGETRVVLTRRAATLRTHQGQVSLPGGKLDPGESAPAAAVREAYEEVALEPSLVRLVGALETAFTHASGSLITPVVGTLRARPTLVPNPVEVDRVFDVSLVDLAASFAEEHWSEPGAGSFPMYFFEVEGETVWGVTARMLVDLLSVVLGAPGATSQAR